MITYCTKEIYIRDIPNPYKHTYKLSGSTQLYSILISDVYFSFNVAAAAKPDGWWKRESKKFTRVFPMPPLFPMESNSVIHSSQCFLPALYLIGPICPAFVVLHCLYHNIIHFMRLGLQPTADSFFLCGVFFNIIPLLSKKLTQIKS